VLHTCVTRAVVADRVAVARISPRERIWKDDKTLESYHKT